MTYSANDYVSSTLGLALEVLNDEAMEQAETDDERDAIQSAAEEVERARDIALQREHPTPSQKLLAECGGEIPEKPPDPRDTGE